MTCWPPGFSAPLDPAEEKTVPAHLAECESCAAEAEGLWETVRLLEGPALGGAAERAAGDADSAGPRPPLSQPGPAKPPLSQPGPAKPRLLLPTGRRGADARGTGRPSSPPSRHDTLHRHRPPPDSSVPATDVPPRVAAHAAPYAAAVAGLKALLPEVEGRWATPVVHDWDVHATVAHLLAADEHLAGRLGIGPRVPPSPIAQDPPWEGVWNRRTAEVIAREHGRTPEETVADWSAQAEEPLGTAEARAAELAARAVTLMGLRLPVADQSTPTTSAAPWASPCHRRPRSTRGSWSASPSASWTWPWGPPRPRCGEEWVLGSEAEPIQAELTLPPYDFCLPVGGRYAPDAVPRGETGDAAAVRNVLETAASPAWL